MIEEMRRGALANLPVGASVAAYGSVLGTLPGTILLALVAPGIFSAGVLGGVAALATALCAWKTKNLLLAMLAGMGMVAAGRLMA